MAITELNKQPPKSKSLNPVTRSLLLSSAFIQTPFAPPFSRPSSSKPNLVPFVPENVIRHLHHSIVSTADKFWNFLNQNPVFKNIISLSSEFQSFCNEVKTCRNDYVKITSYSPLSNHDFAAVLPGDSVAGVVVANGILNFLNIYNTLLIVRLVLTWFPNSPPAIVSPLSAICDPYLNIFRGIIPPLGGTLDLSPILAFIVLNAFTSTAAALPAELPVAGQPPRSASSPSLFTALTSSQKKWMRRLNQRRAKNSKSNADN
ncbi:copper-transporting ATPase PAA2 [Hibiscus syriacus]|uniref:Copper-transporting ATPase PAA2 n=1 Tax=Hibiscus syriacus TaxID=106335 RepID=A0A6A3BS59_HIBSY|nr:ylmG homolog protein 2, chloroplastic-like [Hibiscus syriacus]KAE8718857.1 copper-transporting ATPase PAA2 [Hibiscus syriacus]